MISESLVNESISYCVDCHGTGDQGRSGAGQVKSVGELT